MFEAGFTYILSKSLMNTRTKNPLIPFGIGGFLFFCRKFQMGFAPHGLLSVPKQWEGPGDGAECCR